MRSFTRATLTICLAAAAVVIILTPCAAKPVDGGTALQAAETWLAANPAPMVTNPAGKVWKAKGVRPFLNVSGEVIAYIVDLKPQGFIIVPADDEIEPILTFGTEGDFSGSLSPDEVLSAILVQDIPSRLNNPGRTTQAYKDKVAERWSTVTSGQNPAGSNVIVGTVSPVVNPLVSDLWDQGPQSAPYTYNYYTPNHYVTGCVATAMGMIVHYHRYPAAASDTNTIYVGGIPSTRSFNDTFNYDLMPTQIFGNSPLENILEVAKLLYDCGISINMQYDSVAHGGSGAYTTDVVSALKNVWHYTTANWKSSGESDWASVLKAELSAGYPTEMEIWDNQDPLNPAGHAIVCDGWGTESGSDRFHLNLGWSGYANNWYSVPGFSAGGYYWDTMTGYVYNVRSPNDLAVMTPSFNPDGGAFDSSLNVAVTCGTTGAVIHYTTTGVDPTEQDPAVSGPVVVDHTLTLKAKAWKTGQVASGVKSATYTFGVNMPAFAPDAGGLCSPMNVAITCATTGAVIHYTTNGLDPTAQDPIVNGAVRVARAMTLKARAWKTGLSPSAIKSAAYTLVLLADSKKLGNNSTVSIPQAIVSAIATTGLFYVEGDDRSCGIMVSKGSHGLAPGKRVSIQGTTQTTAWGEKYVTATSVTDAGTGTARPLVLNNRDLGGADYYYNSTTKAGQKGMKDNPNVYSRALNNIGLLITTTGRVTYSASGYFYIDDGSGLVDNSGYVGIKVMGAVPPPDPLPPGWTPIGHCVKVTGASSCFKAASPSTDLYRQIWCSQVTLIQ